MRGDNGSKGPYPPGHAEVGGGGQGKGAVPGNPQQGRGYTGSTGPSPPGQGVVGGGGR